jgi:hypothetical protein
MDSEALQRTLLSAQTLANVQPGANRQIFNPRPDQGDPALNSQFRISAQDLTIFKQKFPMLQEFSDEFLQSRTMDELLRIESTSIRIRESERSKETEERLANNKSSLESKYFDVPSGRDNRWTDLHPARYLPGAACTAIRQYRRAREVWGLASPPAVGCYDMNCVGMGGYVQNKGWLELGTFGSSKLKIEYFNINNAARSSSSARIFNEDTEDMKDVSEFELALRTLRSAAQFAVPWNYSFLALENFCHQKKFFKDELKGDENPARTLCHFCNFVIGENANHWRDGTGFLSTGDLESYWASFIGARPQARSKQPSLEPQMLSKPMAAIQKPLPKKRKFPFVDICGKWNVGNCAKPAGACYNFRGVPLRHVCNWRDPSVQNAQPCGGNHMRQNTHP